MASVTPIDGGVKEAQRREEKRRGESLVCSSLDVKGLDEVLPQHSGSAGGRSNIRNSQTTVRTDCKNVPIVDQGYPAVNTTSCQLELFSQLVQDVYPGCKGNS